jgi:hypothetical protein
MTGALLKGLSRRRKRRLAAQRLLVSDGGPMMLDRIAELCTRTAPSSRLCAG